MQKLENQKSESVSKEGTTGMGEEAVQTGPGEARAFMGLNHAIENRYVTLKTLRGKSQVCAQGKKVPCKTGLCLELTNSCLALFLLTLSCSCSEWRWIWCWCAGMGVLGRFWSLRSRAELCGELQSTRKTFCPWLFTSARTQGLVVARIALIPCDSTSSHDSGSFEPKISHKIRENMQDTPSLFVALFLVIGRILHAADNFTNDWLSHLMHADSHDAWRIMQTVGIFIHSPWMCRQGARHKAMHCLELESRVTRTYACTCAIKPNIAVAIIAPSCVRHSRSIQTRKCSIHTHTLHAILAFAPNENKVLTSIAHLVLNSQTNALSDACNACKRNTHV